MLPFEPAQERTEQQGRSIPDKNVRPRQTGDDEISGISWRLEHTRWGGHKEELPAPCGAGLGLLCFVCQHAADPRNRRSKDSSEVSGEMILTSKRVRAAAVRSLAAELAC